MHYLLIAIISLGLLSFFGCEPQEPQPVKPNKPVVTYIFEKLKRDLTYKIPSNELKGVVSSGNGEYVYAVGEKPASLMALSVEKGLWHEALSDFKAVKKATDRTTVNLGKESVSGFETFGEGILFTLTNDKGLVVLKGIGEDGASLYMQNANNFPAGAYTPFFVTKKDNSHFIYLFASGQTPAKRGILFRTYVEPPKLDNEAKPPWDKSFRKTQAPKADLDTLLWARVQDNEKNLLLADKDGVKRINEADLGVTQKAFDNNGKPIYETKEFMLDGKTKNDHINTMEFVDNKLLVIGLQSTEPNNGGVAVCDITEKTLKWQHFGKGLGLSVDFIAQERIKQRDKTKLAAVIATDKGLLLMDNEGKMMEVTDKSGFLVTAKSINNHRAEISSWENAHDGFMGDRVPETVTKYLGGGQDKDGTWYLGFKGKGADDGGIYKFDVRIDQVASPTAPPILP